MLLVVSFALGVERGKAVSVSAKAAEAAAIPAQAEVRRAPVIAPAQQTVQPKTANPVTNISPKGKELPYTIVAAAFSKEAFAVKEVSKLKGSGLEAFVIKRDTYYLACVGSFASKDSAGKMLNKIKQMHRDAYIRLK